VVCSAAPLAQAVRQDPPGSATKPTRPAWFPQARTVRRVPDRRHRTAGRAALNRRWAQVLVPKLGWVRFRLSRPVPDARSYRVTRDRVGRWHVAFAAIPVPIPGPSTGEVVGIDRGVTVTLALSDGHAYQAPTDRDVKRLQRRLARAKRGSNRRAKLKARHARLHARNADARRDWVEKVSTEIARGYDLIRIEDLDVAGMTRSARGTVAQPGRHVGQKASLNGSILRSGWGMLPPDLSTRPGAGSRRSIPHIRASVARSAGPWIGGLARAKPPSGAGPADTSPTPTTTLHGTSRRDTPRGEARRWPSR